MGRLGAQPPTPGDVGRRGCRGCGRAPAPTGDSAIQQSQERCCPPLPPWGGSVAPGSQPRARALGGQGLASEEQARCRARCRAVGAGSELTFQGEGGAAWDPGRGQVLGALHGGGVLPDARRVVTCGRRRGSGHSAGQRPEPGRGHSWDCPVLTGSQARRTLGPLTSCQSKLSFRTRKCCALPAPQAHGRP